MIPFPFLQMFYFIPVFSHKKKREMLNLSRRPVLGTIFLRSEVMTPKGPKAHRVHSFASSGKERLSLMESIESLFVFPSLYWPAKRGEKPDGGMVEGANIDHLRDNFFIIQYSVFVQFHIISKQIQESVSFVYYNWMLTL